MLCYQEKGLIAALVAKDLLDLVGVGVHGAEPVGVVLEERLEVELAKERYDNNIRSKNNEGS